VEEQLRKDMIQFIEGSRDAVVCSIDEHGFPNAKTMFRRKTEDLRTIWFSSNVSAVRTQQWTACSKACVYFFDREDNAGLMLTGHIKIFTDDETKRLHWNQGDEQYYRLGPTDPDYCMLRFTADKGNYMSGNKYLFSLDGCVSVAAHHYDGKWTQD
jgi:general stress protein 26